MNYNLLNKYIDNIRINNILEYQIALGFLRDIDIEENDLRILFTNLYLNDDEIIIVSDTHYGSIYDNFDYIKLVYEYAKKNNIKTILHGGDFIQGTYAPVRDSGINVFEQLESTLYKYPHDKNIKNYLLLGNHDYLLIRKSIEKTFELFNIRNDINVIGLKNIYINWKDYLVYMYHNIPKLYLYNHKLDTLIKLYGHHHDYNYSDNLGKVYLPSLSDDIKYYGNVVYPGFIKAKLDEKALVIQFYPIANNKIYDTGISLRKELKNYDYLRK